MYTAKNSRLHCHYKSKRTCNQNFIAMTKFTCQSYIMHCWSWLIYNARIKWIANVFRLECGVIICCALNVRTNVRACMNNHTYPVQRYWIRFLEYFIVPLPEPMMTYYYLLSNCRGYFDNNGKPSCHKYVVQTIVCNMLVNVLNPQAVTQSPSFVSFNTIYQYFLELIRSHD